MKKRDSMSGSPVLFMLSFFPKSFLHVATLSAIGTEGKVTCRCQQLTRWTCILQQLCQQHSESLNSITVLRMSAHECYRAGHRYYVNRCVSAHYRLAGTVASS